MTQISMPALTARAFPIVSESFKFDSSNIFSFEDMRALLTLVRAEVRRILNCVRYNIILHRIHLKKNL